MKPPSRYIVWRLVLIASTFEMSAPESRAISERGSLFHFTIPGGSGDYRPADISSVKSLSVFARSICIRFANARSEICRFNCVGGGGEGGGEGQGRGYIRVVSLFCSYTRSQKRKRSITQWNFQRAKAGEGRGEGGRWTRGGWGRVYSPNGI